MVSALADCPVKRVVLHGPVACPVLNLAHLHVPGADSPLKQVWQADLVRPACPAGSALRGLVRRVQVQAAVRLAE